MAGLGEAIPIDTGINVGQAVGTVSSVGIWLFFFAILLVVFLYFVNYTSYKVNFRVKKIVNGRKIIINTKAKIKKNSDGMVILELRQKNPFSKAIQLPAPPEEAIELNAKGKECIEAYKTSTGEYIYLKDISTIPEIPKDILNINDALERYRKINEWKKANGVINAYQPLTSNQRMFFTGQIRKAHEKKQRSVMDLIRDLAPLMAIVIMFVMFLLFFGKAVQPFMDMSEKAIALQKENVAYVEQIKEMKSDIQTIKNEVMQNNEQVQANPPN